MTQKASPRLAEPLGILLWSRPDDPGIAKVLKDLEQKGVAYATEDAEAADHLLVVCDECPEDAEWNALLPDCLRRGCRVMALYIGSAVLPFQKAWHWMAMGVEDVFSLAETPRIATVIAKKLQRWAVIKKVLQSDRVTKSIFGSSVKWMQLMRHVVEVACFSNNGVLLQGESGTGKELIARLIHDLDRRPEKSDLVLLDCTTVVPELSGSEFFGHEKGSFTNALSMREGAFGLADDGTLFLDEVGELPPSMQAALLRVIQEGAYKRVGSNQWRTTKFRLICATNRNLEEEVARGRFRQDLYYRISADICTLPPLSERREDIVLLAERFLQEALQWDYAPPIGEHLRSFLLSHSYPGNVRELRQLMRRMALRYPGEGVLGLGCLAPGDRQLLPDPQSRYEADLKNALRLGIANGACLKDIKRTAAEIAMDIAIEEAGENLQAAAHRLDVTDRVLQLHRAEKRMVVVKNN
jgi:transcriptional regulator with GAF, ATPase, and Fis domain